MKKINLPLIVLLILALSLIVIAQPVFDDVPVDGGQSPSEPSPTTTIPSETSQPEPSPTAPPETTTEDEAPTYVGFEDKFPEGSEFETVGDWFEVKTSDDETHIVGRVYKQNVIKDGKVVVTGYTIKTMYGEDISRITEGGKYQKWDANNNQWVDTNQAGFEQALKESYKNQLLEQGISPEEAEKIADGEAKRQAKEARISALNDGIIPPLRGWQTIGQFMRSYDKYKGIGEFFVLAWPEYGEWSREWRRTISQSFCGFVSIQNCFESLICGAVLDISAGDAISGNVLFGRGPNGQPLTAGTISAERSLPIVLKGLERERLREIVGENVELIVIGGEVINISEVDTTTLPAAEFRLYKVQYSLTNTNDREMKYNLEFKGQTTREFFSSDKKLSPGQTVPSEDRNIEVYSATKYDEVCMTFNPSLPAGTGSTLIVAPKMVSKLCKPIVEYAGGATSVGNYAKKADEEKKQGAPSGGFI